MKSLAGDWEGPVTVDPPQPEMSDGKPLHVSMRVTSRGNTLVHEMQEAGTPLDATKYDHPVTMFYVDGDQLTLVHYCDAGNRPRMAGQVLGGRKDGGIRFSRHLRQHEVRTHAPCGVHHHRREPSHRGLDVHDARGQADPRALRPAADKVTDGVSPDKA